MSGRPAWLGWLAALSVVVSAGAVAVFLMLALFGERPTEGGPQPAVRRLSGPTLRHEVTLLTAPRDGAAPLATLQAGVPVAVTGRSEDGQWLAVEISGRNVSGWAPVSAVANIEHPETLSVIAGADAAVPTSPASGSDVPTQTPDFADLTVEAVFSRDNRLVVVIANLGDADVSDAVTVSVDGGEAHRVDVGGKPLRPGDTLEAVLPELYVQRRSTVVVEVQGDEGLRESILDNNKLSTVVAPDVPNDVELEAFRLDTAARTVTITLKNNSVIPLIGGVTVAVRRTTPSSLLLVRFDHALELAKNGTQQLIHDFDDEAELPGADALQVILSTDAINDAVEGNNVLPR
ncbi:MAG: hypothetical protein QF664_04220 [Dehalococcoidia bacterium]|jgi:hypothetical protein|nr:hypothetical protein [Dehalococcoidia bacterium]